MVILKCHQKKQFQQLKNWFNAQKRHFRKGTLSNEKIERFKEVGYEMEEF